MQKLVDPVYHLVALEPLVQRPDGRVLVGEAESGVFVQAVEDLWPRTWASSLFRVMGWPPPPAQPPGQAMTSTKSTFTSPDRMASTRFRALARPLATAMLTGLPLDIERRLPPAVQAPDIGKGISVPGFPPVARK